ncbi:hypothetical protein, partial [Klebsiella variicola]|uniref:hypothetical protein n=1 Tax=Klebsiella variicola TaxID=244366 RepID=UPI0027319F19
VSSVLSAGVALFFGSLAHQAHTDARAFSRSPHAKPTIMSVETSKGGAFGRIRFSAERGNEWGDCEASVRLGSTSNGFR